MKEHQFFEYFQPRNPPFNSMNIWLSRIPWQGVCSKVNFFWVTVQSKGLRKQGSPEITEEARKNMSMFIFHSACITHMLLWTKIRTIECSKKCIDLYEISWKNFLSLAMLPDLNTQLPEPPLDKNANCEHCLSSHHHVRHLHVMISRIKQLGVEVKGYENIFKYMDVSKKVVGKICNEAPKRKTQTGLREET